MKYLQSESKTRQILCTFASQLSKIKKMEQPKSISKWIESMSMRGHYVFTKNDLSSTFPDMSPITFQRNLTRLMAKNAIVSPWHNFYVIVPTEYKLKGIVPPVFYLDHLMRYLGCQYYVALLNAAEMYGAAHQRPQNFTVFTEGKAFHSGIKAGTEILLFKREHLPTEFVRKFQTQTGYVNVSSPELTALDLVNAEHAVGGLTRVTTVLAELTEEIHFSSVSSGLLVNFKVPVVQRLGYLLDAVLDETEKADELFALAQSSNLHFRKVALKTTKVVADGNEVNKRWKIIVNQEIEIDEL